jgi:undecaprenyl-diphosphatase
MNDYLASLLLGIVEGITEFLPISSTAHLRITENFLNIAMADGYWKMYSIVIQLGAVLCLPVYFRERIRKLVFSFPRSGSIRQWIRHPLSLTLLAFAMTAIPSLLLIKVIGKHLESLEVMGYSLVSGGIIMWLVDRRNAKSETSETTEPGKKNRVRIWEMEKMGILRAIWIGACQSLSAVFPGASRSMATIAAGQLAGMSRAAALEFSFFLSIPTMLAATGYDLLATISGKKGNPLGISGIDLHGWLVLAVGFIISYLVAYRTVAWLLAWVRKHGFTPFAIYRLILGLAILSYIFF